MTITSSALLQREALRILSQMKSKPIIAVDLDYTLWPAICSEHTCGPYQLCPNDGSDESKATARNSLFCTDKKTSSARLLSLFPEVREVLEFCLDNQIILTVCSRSTDKATVQEVLEKFGMWDYFFLPQIFPQRKINHFCNLVEQANLEFTDFLLFDDDPTSIRFCTQMGVTGCLVRKSKGLNWASLVKGLNSFYTNEEARRALKDWLVVAKQRQDSVTSSTPSSVNGGSGRASPIHQHTSGSGSSRFTDDVDRDPKRMRFTEGQDASERRRF
eukprot:CAMPEP_0184973236 /NCGR_PEP_ID=MMETSP1098-20130426/5114_1 /TAXON_ID=89044 /ORGANISM="Spumella elongata, Strain CCAP 955/1" /LENGTH=272 /DNA_ID=CAMNT_0027495681 /DNA_START=180 /DNA_END=998 /DNA_ORIENTATION=+